MPDDTTFQVQQLLDRWHAGDPEGWNRLIERAYRRLERLAHHQLRKFPLIPDDTGDVLHGAYPRLVKKLQTDRPTTAREFFFKATGAIRDQLIDLLRHYLRPGRAPAQGAASPEDGDSASPPGADRPDDTHDPRPLAVWTEFHEKAARLPDNLRAVFDLLWYQDLTQREAAVLLGVHEWKVQEWWHDARLELAKQLGDRLPDF